MSFERFLIVRLSAIGDCVHSLPLLNALREHYPQAHIAWLVEGRTGDLLEGHPALNQVIRVPRKWLKQPKAVLQLRKELRAQRFDVAIDSQGLTKSAVAAWLSGAKVRVGFRGADGRELSPWLNNHKVEPTATHVVDRNLELLTALKIEDPTPRFNLLESPEDGLFAESQLQTLGLHQAYAIINPGAGWPSKLWDPDRFAAVASFLGSEHLLPSLVVWAGTDEKAWAEQIVADSNGHAVMAPNTSLKQLAAFTRRATLFVSADTGPLHMAAAVDTPCVGLFGPVSALRNGPYGPLHISLQREELHGGSRERRNADNQTMLAITVDDVCQACEQILSRRY